MRQLPEASAGVLTLVLLAGCAPSAPGSAGGGAAASAPAATQGTKPPPPASGAALPQPAADAPDFATARDRDSDRHARDRPARDQ
ncbi:MAG TPA: hypothetical protein VNX02_10275 [Steroidobacteraceae bacterium]|nr:hypothetical protein [Steroidobacteraceae bacterium]